MIEPAHITGLVLAGGRGSRMGGVDKGLQLYRGRPLAENALRRLAPQVGAVMISANRHLADYAALGAPVWPDTPIVDFPGAGPLPDFPGPLAGLLAGLAHCTTAYLASVPCDCPRFPGDLVQRLAAALVEAEAEIAIAATHDGAQLRSQPVFCLLGIGLLNSLQRFLQSGQRKVERWTQMHRCILVPFDDATAFANANTLGELRLLDDGA